MNSFFKIIKHQYRKCFWWIYRNNLSWYDFQYGFKNLWKYRKVVWRARDWDYHFTVDMMKFQLKSLCSSIEEGNEIDETRLPKVVDIRRVIELIDNMQEDNYAERCGYKHDERDFDEMFVSNAEGRSYIPNPNYSEEELKEIFEKAFELQEQEMEEFGNLMKKINTWWT